jgi:metal-responsive CopG/Arc/MetJ family transcriptional regulator
MWKDLRQEIIVTGFSCDKALADRARAYAKEHGNRGLSSLIREALQEYMDRKDGVSKK